MPGRPQLRAGGVALVALLAAAACGTTVPLTDQVNGTQAGPGVDGSGLGGGGLGTGSSTGGLGGTAGGGSLGGSASSGGTTGSLPGTTGGTGFGGTTGSGGTTGGSSGRDAPGVTPNKVYVGFIYDRNAGKVNEAVGVGSITSGDARANTNAIVKDINARGGLGGRELVPVWANFDSASSQTLDQQYSAVCQSFTRDARVFAVPESGTPSYKECLSKAGVLMLSSDLPQVGARELRQWPGLIEMGYPNLDRLGAFFLKPLVDQKYFTPWDALNARPAPTGTVKVGILTLDDPVFRRAVETSLVPGLRRLGYDPIVYRVAPLSRAADASSQAAATKSAVLTFQSANVTHVIPFESNGNLSTLFLPNARSQQYYPRLGVYTGSAAEALLESGAMEAKQFNGSVGFGWVPALDLRAEDNPANGPYSNPARRYCLSVYKKNGITFDSGNAEGIGLNTCASLYLLKAALDKRPTPVTLANTLGIIESLGTSYEKPGGLGMEFRRGRQDPLNAAYYWRYLESCTCYRYQGTRVLIP